MGLFDPDRLAVYRLARVHTRAVHALINATNTRGHSDLVGQQRRSTASIPANLLEAFRERRLGKRLHYLMIAKGSAWESWAHSDTWVDFQLATAESISEVHDAQRQITALLITTIRKLEAEGILEEPPHAH